jgi:hypothetical protein
MTTMSDDTRVAILATATDYVQGGYEADSARIARSLHPDLAKRIVRANPDGSPRLDGMSALGLIRLIDGKSPAPADERLAAIDILALDGDIATVRVEMQHWIDHLQLCFWNGRWLVVNALWRLKAPPPGP